MSTVEKLNLINQYKGSIRDSLQNKGADISEETPLREYAEIIENLEIKGDNGGFIIGEDGTVAYNPEIDWSVDLDAVGWSAVKSSAFAYSPITSVKGLGVTNIGYQAFSGCKNLVEVDFPNFTSATYPNPNSQFANCTNLERVNMALTIVTENMFQGCVKLSDIDLTNVGRLRLSGFANCFALTEANMVNLSMVASHMFERCINLERVNMPNITLLPQNAFISCISLKELNTPLAIRVEDACFTDCVSLSEINLPEVSVISSAGNYSSGAFHNCCGLKKAVLPKCSTIGSKAFQGCLHLSEIEGAEAITTIGSGAFSYCYGITREMFPNATSVATNAFTSNYSTLSGFVSAKITYVDLSNITTVGTSCFAYCSNLSKVNLSDTTVVSNYGFYQCVSLKEIDLPLCATVGSSAFYQCGVSTISLPAVTSIGSRAFYQCSALSEAYFTGEVVPTLGHSNAFTDTHANLSIYVRPSLVDAFKTAVNWSTYASRIFPYEGEL